MSTKPTVTYIRLKISVKGCNPNGDIDSENRPRQNQNGLGIISSNCIKYRIKKELKVLGADIGRDETNTISALADECKKNPKGFYNKYLDYKLFGSVMATAGGGAGPKNRTGIVFVNDAYTKTPVDVEDLTITSSTNDKDIEEKSSNTIGKKYRVGNENEPVYYYTTIVADWSKTGDVDISIDEIEMFKTAVNNLFTNSCSEARPLGSIEVDSVLGVDYFGAKIIQPSKIFDISNEKIFDSILDDTTGNFKVF